MRSPGVQGTLLYLHLLMVTQARVCKNAPHSTLRFVHKGNTFKKYSPTSVLECLPSQTIRFSVKLFTEENVSGIEFWFSS